MPLWQSVWKCSGPNRNDSTYVMHGSKAVLTETMLHAARQLALRLHEAALAGKGPQ